MAADLDNPMGYPESPKAALEVLEILRRVYVPKNTNDAKMGLAALNVLRVDLARREAAEQVMHGIEFGRRAKREGKPREAMQNDCQRIGWDEAAHDAGMQVKEPTEARGDGVKEPSCAALEQSHPGDTDLRWCYRCGEGVIPGMCRASKACVGEVDRG